MRTYTIYPTLTPKRLAYLWAVEANALYEPRHDVTANHCLALGWVETVVSRDGEVLSWDELPRGEDFWPAVQRSQILGQRLTDKGRQVLEDARS